MYIPPIATPTEMYAGVLQNQTQKLYNKKEKEKKNSIYYS